MRTTQQKADRKEPNDTVSASKSGKTVLIKKRRAQSSRSVSSDNESGTGPDSSKHRTSTPMEDLDARIAMRAYELYLQRGGCHGEDQADWFEAERQILARA